MGVGKNFSGGDNEKNKAEK